MNIEPVHKMIRLDINTDHLQKGMRILVGGEDLMVWEVLNENDLDVIPYEERVLH